MLDWPLISYLSILLLSTLFSIDPRTSWLGYYSRFNGGLISQICYALLYWAFVSNLNQKETVRTIYYALLSTAIVGMLAIAEHFGIFTTCYLMGFGIKESCWVQDVQNRVFSTLGQPNWLAAVVTALLPITFAYSLKHKAYSLLSILFFVTLLFTKSRSGFLAFGISSLIFWGYIFWQTKLKYLKEFLILSLALGLLSIAIFFPRTNDSGPSTAQGTSLEAGGTESGTIREYVWQGALSVFKNHPILGGGPETFAFVFPKYKPIEHNLTSEWDFIYNKAHNEFLNYLANTGILGLGAYLVLIVTSILQISNYNYSKYSNYSNNSKIGHYLGQIGKLEISIISGYIAILTTNFFGFSVVPISLLFFLFPALAVVSSTQNNTELKKNKLDTTSFFLIAVVLFLTSYLLHLTYRYWRADFHYNQSKIRNSISEIKRAIEISPKESLYKSQYAILASEETLKYLNDKDEDRAKEYAKIAVDEAEKSVSLSPMNLNNQRILSTVYYRFASLNVEFLNLSETVLTDSIKISPNDPKLYYQLGLLNLKLGKITEGVKNLEKSVELKPNYKEGRFALGLTYKDTKRYEDAIKEFNYILEKIDPNDDLTKKHLQEAVENMK